jgi:hypothetical protein
MGKQFFSVELRVLDEDNFLPNDLLFRRKGCFCTYVLAKSYQHGNYKDLAPSLYRASKPRSVETSQVLLEISISVPFGDSGLDNFTPKFLLKDKPVFAYKLNKLYLRFY